MLVFNPTALIRERCGIQVRWLGSYVVVRRTGQQTYSILQDGVLPVHLNPILIYDASGLPDESPHLHLIAKTGV